MVESSGLKAYTLGNPASYDPVEPGTMKLGRKYPGLEYPDGYEGGIVFKSAEDAAEWADVNGYHYNVYELLLPASWDECVGKGNWDGIEYDALLVDCPLIGKVL